ncbi:MAG: hypothetical protein ACXVEE_41745, partial [Polyangiales bacterium]
FVKPDSSFAVVLTRAVEPVPDALVLLDQAGEPVKGTTTWLDRQFVVFYPEQKLPLGADLHLRIAVPLHASDGAVLSPREVDHAAMPPMKLLQANVVGGDLRPMSAIQLVFEREVPAADVGAHGVLTVDGDSIDFIASDEGHRVLLRAAHGFPPGHEARFAWKEGPVVLTSAGRVSLEPVIKKAKQGLYVRVGEPGEHCSMGVQDHIRCNAELAHVHFPAPIPDDQLALHVHPPLVRATTGDLRGHRFEVALPKNKKKVVIVLDAELADSFGQTLGKKITLEIVRDS